MQNLRTWTEDADSPIGSQITHADVKDVDRAGKPVKQRKFEKA